MKKIVQGKSSLFASLSERASGFLTRDVINTAINLFWRLVSGPLTMLLLPLLTTSKQQGFWYTFPSISALTTFADLGFTYIICQFAAHEFAFVNMNEKFAIYGDSTKVNRLASLFRFTLRWCFGVCLVSFPVIFSIGFFLFIKQEAIGFWLVPWIIYLIGSMLAFANSILASFLQGCNQVAATQRVGFIVGIINTGVLVFCLVFRLGLFALAISILVSNIVYLIMIIMRYRALFSQLLGLKDDKTCWRKEILPLLSKYAVSWTGGYLSFQLFTPLAFHFFGSEVAGQVGISITLIQAMFTLSNTWFTANTPKMYMLVAKQEWNKLDVFFVKNLLLTIVTYCLGIVVLFTTVIFCHDRFAFFSTLASRFLGLLPLCILLLGWFAQLVINGMAIYLRAHKKEPLMVYSVASGVLIALSTYACVIFLSPTFIFLGFLLSYCLSLPWVFAIFTNKRKLWHCSAT
jgi:hypothetical protein